MPAVCVELAKSLLLRQQPESTLGQIEQGADTRVRLSVVVSKGTFIISLQASDSPIGDQCPVMAEGLVNFELDSLIFALGILVSVRLAVGVEFTSKCRAGSGLLALRQAWAVRKKVAGRIGPSICIHCGEARASGRSLWKCRDQHVERNIGSGIPIRVKTCRGHSRRLVSRPIRGV